jgi:hypothetical protein
MRLCSWPRRVPAKEERPANFWCQFPRNFLIWSAVCKCKDRKKSSKQYNKQEAETVDSIFLWLITVLMKEPKTFRN